MTYREWYADNHPGVDARDVDISLCPDHVIPPAVLGPFSCPSCDCDRCWDRQLPAKEEME